MQSSLTTIDNTQEKCYTILMWTDKAITPELTTKPKMVLTTHPTRVILNANATGLLKIKNAIEETIGTGHTRVVEVDGVTVVVEKNNIVEFE